MDLISETRGLISPSPRQLSLTKKEDTMNTYKSYSYKGKDPIEVTVNNVNLHDVRDGFTEGFTCWVLVDKEIAFQVDYQGDDKLRLDGFSFGINHFDDKEDFNKLTSTLNEQEHLEEIIWELVHGKNDAEKTMLIEGVK